MSHLPRRKRRQTVSPHTQQGSLSGYGAELSVEVVTEAVKLASEAIEFVRDRLAAEIHPEPPSST
jgi:hypothetical protein